MTKKKIVKEDVVKDFLDSAGQVVSTLDPKDIGDVINSFTQMAQNLSAQKQQAMNKMNRVTSIGMTQRNENKKIVLTKGELKNLMVEAIQASKRRSLIESAMKKHLKEELASKKLIEHYLNEGPLSQAWQGVKSGARNLISQGAEKVGQMASGVQQSTAAAQRQDQIKQAQKVAQDAIKSVSRVKQKFAGETLKNSNLINQYHDSVVNLVSKVLPSLQGALPGPAFDQLKSQVDQIIGQLHYDLTSEKEAIDTFLGSLKKNVPMTTDVETQSKIAGQQYAPEEGPKMTRDPSAQTRLISKGRK